MIKFKKSPQTEVVYTNVNSEKLKILKYNRGKAGVYRLMNLVNGNSYIGSSIDLGKRLRCYFITKHLKGNKMVISKALLKYGYINFSLEILEYCEQSLVITREQYYMDLLEPEYNILKFAGSRLGFKHSTETIAKI
jgi:group I intron endonuclease